MEIDTETIDLTVTSPPYDGLRKYNGYSFDFEKVANELYRVTKQGSVVVWIVGDQSKNGSETGTSFKQALYFMSIGFNLHDTMIYRKNNRVPQNHNRYDQEFEYMFILSKGKPKTFNPIKEKCITAGATYKINKGKSASRQERFGAMREKQSKTGTIETAKYKFRGNVWTYDVGKNKTSKDDIFLHPATFPEKLAQDHIQSWSNENDLILDPFMGSGTTAKMAILNNRRFIGFEISKEYCELADKRIDYLRRQVTIFNIE